MWKFVALQFFFGYRILQMCGSATRFNFTYLQS